MHFSRSTKALIPAAILAALACAPAASAAQILPQETGFNQLISQGSQPWNSHGGSGSAGASTEAESTNWSGYAATGSTYTTVSTSWVQPSVNCNTTPNSYAAFWDGLDGYSSETVEQTGTMGECAGRTAEYYAWYETYPNPSYSVPYAVNPGDVITATVSVVPNSDNEGFNLTLSDASVKGGKYNWSETTTQTVKSAPALSSAEVIAEAPSNQFGQILPLANFGSVAFSNPTVDGTALSTQSGLSEIEMVAQQRRSVVPEASPSAISSAGFSITWES